MTTGETAASSRIDTAEKDRVSKKGGGEEDVNCTNLSSSSVLADRSWPATFPDNDRPTDIMESVDAYLLASISPCGDVAGSGARPEAEGAGGREGREEEDGEEGRREGTSGERKGGREGG